MVANSFFVRKMKFLYVSFTKYFLDLFWAILGQNYRNLSKFGNFEVFGLLRDHPSAEAISYPAIVRVKVKILFSQK